MQFRQKLKKHPLLYALVGGVGVVLFWRGVWHLTDFLALIFMASRDTTTSIDWAQGADSFVSLVIGGALLLVTGLFVSELLSGEVLIASVKKEEEMTEKAEAGIKKESSELPRMEREIHEIKEELEHLEEDIHRRRE